MIKTNKIGGNMEDSRQKEILLFFAQGNTYGGLKLEDTDFTDEELSELIKAEYIMCTDLKLRIYVITIKGWRCLRGIAG